MRSIFVGSRTRRSASSVTSRVGAVGVGPWSNRPEHEGISPIETIVIRSNQRPGFSLRVLSVLCVSAVNAVSRTLTAETPRTRRFRREMPLLRRLLWNGKYKIPPPLLSRKGDRLATGSFPEKRNPCGLNTFSRAFKSCNSVRAGLLAFASSLKQRRRSSQWRDRAGFSPASLFFPLQAGHPNAFERTAERDVPEIAGATYHAC